MQMAPGNVLGLLSFNSLTEIRSAGRGKGEKSEGIWDLDQAGNGKGGTLLQRPTLNHFLETAAFGRGSAFGVGGGRE